MRNNDVANSLDPAAPRLPQLLHDASNSLHSLGLNVELAHLKLKAGDVAGATKALEAVLAEREHGQSVLKQIREQIVSHSSFAGRE